MTTKATESTIVFNDHTEFVKFITPKLDELRVVEGFDTNEFPGVKGAIGFSCSQEKLICVCGYSTIAKSQRSANGTYIFVRNSSDEEFVIRQYRPTPFDRGHMWVNLGSTVAVSLDGQYIATGCVDRISSAVYVMVFKREISEYEYHRTQIVVGAASGEFLHSLRFKEESQLEVTTLLMPDMTQKTTQVFDIKTIA